MKHICTAILLLLPFAGVFGQGNTRVDSFDIVANGFTYSLNGPIDNIGAYKRGASYIIKAYIYPGNYLEQNCPDSLNCGIQLAVVGYDPFGNPVMGAEPEDTTVIIGDWDCRGFFVQDFSDVRDNGGIFDNNIQTFRFFDKAGSPCPGCVITTEGPVNIVAQSGNDPNQPSSRTIIGGTGPFKYIRGDISAILYGHKHELNITGCCNGQQTLRYEIVEGPLQFGNKLEVSVNGVSLLWDEPNNNSSSYGATVMLEGVIYPDGTLAGNPSGGMDAAGNPEFQPIGKWNCRGWWFSKDHTYNPSEGLFTISQQTFEWEDPLLGKVQVVTEGRDFVGLNETVEKMVVGATGALKGHRGNCSQSLIGINASNGFNFIYDFDTRVVTGAKEEVDRINATTMNLYPNPATEFLSVALGKLEGNHPYRIQVVDAAGRLQTEQAFVADSPYHTLLLDISAWPEGWYALILKREGVVVGSKGFAKVK